MTYFGGYPFGEAAKIGVIYKKQYIPRLTEERMALYSSVMCNQGIYGHMAMAQRRRDPSIFLSYV
jgi:hypothetical protein